MTTGTHGDAARRYLFLLANTRPGGNTELLARHAAEQLPPQVEQRWLRLADLPLPAFEDHRHEGDGSYPEPTGHARTLLDATLDATDLVIASPLYWFSVSADTKLYLDHWSAWMRVPGLDFLPACAARPCGRSPPSPARTPRPRNPSSGRCGTPPRTPACTGAELSSATAADRATFCGTRTRWHGRRASSRRRPQRRTACPLRGPPRWLYRGRQQAPGERAAA